MAMLLLSSTFTGFIKRVYVNSWDRFAENCISSACARS